MIARYLELREPVSGELVERAIREFFSIDGNDKERMGRVLRMFADEFLADPTDEEKCSHGLALQGRKGTPDTSLEGFVSKRRARLLSPAVKTPEERVTIHNTRQQQNDNFTHYIVQLDGITKVEFLMLSDAEIYRLGLIVKLTKAQ